MRVDGVGLWRAAIAAVAVCGVAVFGPAFARAAGETSLNLRIGSAAHVAPGGTATIPVTLETLTSQPAALAFSIVFDPGLLAATGVSAGPAVATAQKQIQSRVDSGLVRVVVFGGRTALSSGVVAEVGFSVAASASPGSTPLMGADASAADAATDPNAIGVTLLSGAIGIAGEGEGEGEGEWTLTTSVSGTGTVRRSPDLVAYPSGTQVTLEAVPGACWTFGHWERGVAGTSSRVTVTMNANREVLAVFVQAGAPVAPAGVDASDGAYADRVRITWNAVPGATGYRVHRSETADFAAATPLGTWQTSPVFDDATAAAPTTEGVFGCFPWSRRITHTYYYWVIARDACAESAPGTPDTGYRGG